MGGSAHIRRLVFHRFSKEQDALTSVCPLRRGTVKQSFFGSTRIFDALLKRDLTTAVASGPFAMKEMMRCTGKWIRMFETH